MKCVYITLRIDLPTILWEQSLILSLELLTFDQNLVSEANKKMDDDGIMVGIYDSIAEELKVKNKDLEKEKEVVSSSFAA